MYDVAVLGAGMAGMATAARLQARGLSTVVLEAHGQPGGCAGYFRQRGFSFDVGATTLVDFEPGGVGAELLDAIGLRPARRRALPGYVAWLPDRTVTLHRDPAAWHAERLRALGDTPAHRRFWALLDRLADVFWGPAGPAIRLPMRTPPTSLARPARGRARPTCRWPATSAGPSATRCARTACATTGRWSALLGMLVEDTVHSTVDDAPLINAALGITIRGAGLTRAPRRHARLLAAARRPLPRPRRRAARRLPRRARRRPRWRDFRRDAPGAASPRGGAGRQRRAGRDDRAHRRRRHVAARPCGPTSSATRPARAARSWSSSACPRREVAGQRVHPSPAAAGLRRAARRRQQHVRLRLRARRHGQRAGRPPRRDDLHPHRAGRLGGSVDDGVRRRARRRSASG